jgi:type VI secretion system VasD/TssJ family lipoprotein
MSLRWPLSALLCLALCAVSGCGSTLTLEVRGIAPLNLTDADESTPVDARIYLLRNDAKFRNAVVDQLWTNDKATLGDDNLGEPKVVTILPGGAHDKPVQVVVGDLLTGTKFIGILALYHRSDAVDKRVLVINVDDVGGKVIEFTRYSVALSTANGGK